jgi:predicted GIY-YIG superfamily endonuclease
MQITWSSFQNLTEENVKKYVPRDAGVYLLWVKLKNGKWRCYYAGQADDLERRLLEHLSDEEKNSCIKAKVRDHISGYEYAKVAKQSDRDGIEKFLYDHYKPECNEKDPGGEPIEVNLP